jgi:hypothetical protein
VDVHGSPTPWMSTHSALPCRRKSIHHWQHQAEVMLASRVDSTPG